MINRAIKKETSLRNIGFGILSILILLISSGLVYADPGDVLWHKTYDFAYCETDLGDTIAFFGKSAAVTQDGGFILTGYLSNTTTYEYRAFLIKTDAEGDTSWFRYYSLDDDAYNYYGVKVFPETDGGYLLAGYKKYPGGVTPPGLPIGAFLAKVDANGDTVWTNIYHDENGTYLKYELKNALRTSDGDYVLCGIADKGTNNPSMDGFLIKTDADGRELWAYYYSPPEIEEAERVHMLFIDSKLTNDGGFLISGAKQVVFPETDSTDSWIDNYGFLMKIDADGDSVWTFQYGEHDQIFDACETSDGGYIVSDLNLDLRGSEPADQVDGFTVLKLDESRNEMWNIDMSYEGGITTDTSIVAHSVCEMLNGEGYIFTGTKSWAGGTNEDIDIWPEGHMFLAQYDTYGNGVMRIYETEFGTADSMPIVPLDLVAMENGNYLVCGYVGSFKSIIYNMWFRPIKAFIAEIEGGTMVSIDDNRSSILPERLTLNQNYPNPFNATTSIRFSLSKSDDVTLSVYDILGRQVNTLYNGSLAAGTHSITWDGTDKSGDVVGSGVYFYRLKTSDDVSTKQMLLLK